MGTIAARDALRVLELTEQVVSAMLIAARQAVALRLRMEPDSVLSETMRAWQAELCARVGLIEEDRALDKDLQRLLAVIRARMWSVYAD